MIDESEQEAIAKAWREARDYLLTLIVAGAGVYLAMKYVLQVAF